MSETKNSPRGGNMSRYEMLQWVNGLVQGDYSKIEDLCSGVAYCRLMAMLFPKSINQKRVKTNPRLEHEYVHNLRLLQEAFNRLKLDKMVPIDRLIQGRFMHNFEFLQWFKKFYDSQMEAKKPAATKEKDPVKEPRLENKQSLGKAQVIKPVKPRFIVKEEDLIPELEMENTQSLAEASQIQPSVIPNEEAPMPEPLPDLDNSQSSGTALEIEPIQEEPGFLEPELVEVQMMEENAINTRDLAYRKLILIEKLINEVSGDDRLVNLCQRIQAVLIAPMDVQLSAEANEETGVPEENEYPNEGLNGLGIF